MSIVEEIKQSYKDGGALTRLIYINIGVFVAIRILHIVFSISTSAAGLGNFPILEWVSVPSIPFELMLKPWTIFTYMFVHYDFFHVLFNVLYLYWFGKIFLEFLNPRQLLGVYVMGGLSGAVLYLLAYNLVPLFYQNFPSSILMGASASVMAILFAVAKYAPEHQIYLMFFGPVRLKYIALVAFVIDIVSIPTMQNTGGHLAHMGGAGFGFLYGGWLLQGNDVTLGFNRFMDRLMSLFSRQSHLTIVHKRPLSDMEYNKQKNHKQREVDAVLDKVKASGYDSLSKKEKQILFDASKN